MTVRSWDEYQKGLLLGGRWLPVTSTVLFARASMRGAVDSILTGNRARVVLETNGSPQQAREVTGKSLEELLATLLPLTGDDWRYLFMPTASPEWIAIFSSCWRGQDPGSLMAWLAVRGIESVAITDVPDNYDRATRQGFAGARMIEMYELDQSGNEIGHSLGVRKNDSSKWELVSPSVEFPVGNVWDPTAKRVPDRFTHEHLVEMSARFGLRRCDDDFYAPNNEAVLVEHTGAEWPNARHYTLAQARGEEPRD